MSMTEMVVVLLCCAVSGPPALACPKAGPGAPEVHASNRQYQHRLDVLVYGEVDSVWATNPDGHGCGSRGVSLEVPGVWGKADSTHETAEQGTGLPALLVIARPMNGVYRVWIRGAHDLIDMMTVEGVGSGGGNCILACEPDFVSGGVVRCAFMYWESAAGDSCSLTQVYE